MRNRINGWEANYNEDREQVAAANRALVSGERKVWDANFSYQMALSSGDPQKIHAAEAALKQALAEDIRRKGGRMEDVLLMQRSFHGTNGNPNKSKWLAVIGLTVLAIFFFK